MNNKLPLFFLRSLGYLICTLASLSFSPITDAQEAESSESYSIETIKSEITRIRETVSKFYVDFTITSEPDEQLKNAPILQQLGKSGYQKFAFDGSRRYNESFTKFFDKNLADESLLMTYDGKKLYSRTQKRVKVSFQKSGSIDMCNYLNILLWPISSQDFDQLQQEAPDVVPFLPRMLDSKWTIDVHPILIGQHECVRLVEENRKRELFLSPKMNFAVVRYTFADETTGLGFGKMICNFSDFQAYGEAFLPSKIESDLEIFDGNTSKLAGLLRTRIEVRELKINEHVLTGLFEFSPAPGDMVMNYDTGEIHQFTEEGDENRLQVSLMEAKRSVSHLYRSNTLVDRLWKWMIVAMFLGGLSFAASKLFINKWSRAKNISHVIVFCAICILNPAIQASCLAQENDEKIGKKTDFNQIFYYTDRFFFDVDLDGTLISPITGIGIFETPASLIELLLDEDVSKVLELAAFQTTELREVHQQLADAQTYTVEIVSMNSILTEIDKARCLEKLVPAIESGNKLVEKTLLSFQTDEFAKILLIFQIRRIGLYSALTTGLLRSTIECTPSQIAKMETVLKHRNEEVLTKLRKMRIDSVKEILSILNTEQRQKWEARFADFEQIDTGVHGVFIEQLGSRWIELAKQSKIDDVAKKYPQFAFLIFNNKFVIGINGFPKFDFSRPGRPDYPKNLEDQSLLLLMDEDLKLLMDFSEQQENELLQLKELHDKFHEDRGNELGQFVEKFGWDQKLLNDFRSSGQVQRQKMATEVMERIRRLLRPSQMELFERLVDVHGLRKLGITYLLLHSYLRTEFHITDLQAESIQKKSEELFIKLRRESADLEQKINQELISVLNADQQAKLKSITGDSIRMEAGQFDTQYLLREFPQIAQEISEDQALILRFLGKELIQPAQTDR